MLTLDEMLERLKDRNLTIVARETGLSYNTLWRMNRDPEPNPTHDTLKRLSSYFSRQQG